MISVCLSVCTHETNVVVHILILGVVVEFVEIFEYHKQRTAGTILNASMYRVEIPQPDEMLAQIQYKMSLKYVILQ